MESRLIKLIPTLVVTLCLITIQARAQEQSTAEISTSGSDNLPVRGHTTRLSMDIISATAAPPATMSFTSYAFGVEQDIGRRITLMGRLPLLVGKVDGQNFSEIGNPFLGASLKVWELQEYHPLWFSVHGGVRFSRPEAEAVAAARYQEYHTGASLTKDFGPVSFITDATYIQKVNEAVDNLDVGNEVDGYAGLRIDIGEDWTTQGGYVIKHADALRFQNEIIVGDDMYTAADLELRFHLSPLMDLTARMTLPLMSQRDYGPNQAAFGDLSTQASLGRSWSMGVNVGL